MADEAHDDNGSGGDLLALGARGYSCLLFDDPETAWKLHQETHLIAWRGESDGDLRVDRFDARSLLEDRNSFRQLKKRKRDVSDATDAEIKSILAGGEEAVETEEQILHRLRYGDYAVEFPPSEETFAVENKFPYQYSELASDEESDGEPFEPSENVPGYLTLVRCFV
ncbi:unnamed protein product [Phytophthora lilii]|uniref:Unnamed protein product n=1 Tax=Phytophthora lilii TaxID=2077276 RepID=A0A9W6X2L1_9STRA|nr:unnamed protein product [Phytophthora lilii]